MAADCLSKKDIRETALKQREEIQENALRLYSERIVNSLLNQPEVLAASKICIYSSYNHEVDTDSLINKLIQMGKEVYAPVSYKGGTMDFYRIFDINELVPGYKGIREPNRIEEHKLLPEALSHKDIVILPIVAFDNKLNRIGYGKGFYDRYLFRCKSVNRIGLALSVQRTERIPVDEYDIRLDKIITEEEIYE